MNEDIPTPMLSIGLPSTLGTWRDLTNALFGDGPAVKFLDEKIAKHERGREEPVLSDEQQMIWLLIEMEQAEQEPVAVPVPPDAPKVGSRWRRNDTGKTRTVTSFELVAGVWWAWDSDAGDGIMLNANWRERWSEIPPRGCPEIGETWRWHDGRKHTVRSWERVSAVPDAEWIGLCDHDGSPDDYRVMYLKADGTFLYPEQWERVVPEPEPADEWEPEHGPWGTAKPWTEPHHPPGNMPGLAGLRGPEPEPPAFEGDWITPAVAEPEPPARPEWVPKLAAELEIGDVVLWWPGEWQAITMAESDCAMHTVKIRCTGPSERWLYLGELVAVRTEEGQ